VGEREAVRDTVGVKEMEVQPEAVRVGVLVGEGGAQAVAVTEGEAETDSEGVPEVHRVMLGEAEPHLLPVPLVLTLDVKVVLTESERVTEGDMDCELVTVLVLLCVKDTGEGVGDQDRVLVVVTLLLSVTLAVRETDTLPEGVLPPWLAGGLGEAPAERLAHCVGLTLRVMDFEGEPLAVRQEEVVMEGDLEKVCVAQALALAQSVGEAEGERVMDTEVVTVWEALRLPPAREGVAQGVGDCDSVPEPVLLRLAVPQAVDVTEGEREKEEVGH
jgi:hypothetical protein